MTSPPPAAVDELEGHLDAVAVGLVEDELAVPLQRVGAGSSAPGLAGSGICLTQTTTFMRTLLPTGFTWCQVTPGRRHDRDDRVAGAYRRRRPGRPWLRLLLIVNSSASSVTARTRVVIQKAFSADHDVQRRRDEPPGPRHPPRPGRGQPGHRRRGRPRRRRHAERGGQRPGRHRHARWPRCPAARPTCSPARSGCPNDPIEAAAAAARRARARRRSAAGRPRRR